MNSKARIEIGDFVKVVPTNEDKFEEFIGRVEFTSRGGIVVRRGWEQVAVMAGQCTPIEGKDPVEPKRKKKFRF